MFFINPYIVSIFFLFPILALYLKKALNELLNQKQMTTKFKVGNAANEQKLQHCVLSCYRKKWEHQKEVGTRGYSEFRLRLSLFQ